MSAYRWTMEWARAAGIRTLGRLESPSTNTEAKEQLLVLGHRSLVVADHQTAGRGRGDHTWTDSAGQALLSSWIFQTSRAPQPIMSALIGLSLYEAAMKTWPKLTWALKAPNDLHVVVGAEARKVAGILIELLTTPVQGSTAVAAKGSSQVAVIVGVGMNVTGAPTGPMPYPATSVASELAAAGLVLTEASWGGFLSTWVAICEARVLEGLEPALKQSARDSLAAALAHHPEFRDIQSVQPDGSLVFYDGREVSWTAL